MKHKSFFTVAEKENSSGGVIIYHLLDYSGRFCIMNCICLFSLIAGIVVFAAATRRKFFQDWWNKRTERYVVVKRCRISFICVLLVVGAFGGSVWQAVCDVKPRRCVMSNLDL
jgi:hypothetical protein